MASIAHQLQQEWMTQTVHHHLQNQSTKLELNRARVHQSLILVQRKAKQFTFKFALICLTRIRETARSHAGFSICYH
jgi:hypothetical protein